MADPAVLVAIRKKLSEIPGLPTIVWPNQEIRVAAPFLIFDGGPGIDPRLLTTDSEEEILLRPQVSLMQGLGTFTAPGDVILRTIALEFKAGTLLLDDGGAVVGKMRTTPEPDNGRPDAGFFRRDMGLRAVHYQKL